jgi:hypothetical protein
MEVGQRRVKCDARQANTLGGHPRAVSILILARHLDIQG